MEDTIEVGFYHHGLDSEASIGYAEFKCPECNKISHDYGDLWWIHNSPKASDDSCKTYCDMCGADFKMTKTKEYNIYKIEKIEK